MRRRPLVALVLLALVAACGGVDEGAGDRNGDDRLVEVRLEPIAASVPDAFTADVDLDPPGASLAIALPDVPPLGSGVTGALVGLYGGSRDGAVCDVDRLVAFLTDESNADKAEAWAGVAGIDAAGIGTYVDALTAVRLRRDTRVTNHGFRDGRATTVQSILEAGTAVLVDELGVPRVKCGCGNPLLEPDVVDGEAIANPGAAWDGFDAAEVVAVAAADAPLESLTLLDLSTGELFDRPTGSNGDADRDPADLEDKCALVPNSPSCATDGDLAAFCATVALIVAMPEITLSASGGSSGASSTIRNADEALAYLAGITDEVQRLPALAPEAIRADAQVYADAVLAAVANDDAGLLFSAPFDVLTRIGEFVTANC